VSGFKLTISGDSDFVSGNSVYINGETIVNQTTRTEIREVEKIVEKDVIREVEKLVYIQGAVDPIAEEVNNRWTRGDILYAGRTLKWVDNSELDTIPLAAVFGVPGVPNYLKQTPFDVRQFIRKDDALLKYMINKYGLRKVHDDDTAHACQWWVIDGTIDNYMTSVTSEINNVISPFLDGSIPGEFSLMSVPTMNLGGTIALGSTGLGKSFSTLGNKKRTPVLAYSSDRIQEQSQARIAAGLPTLGSYDYWLFPFESLYSGYGDCEDGAILVANLLINAGIPSYKVKVAAGVVGGGGGLFASGTAHLWCIYLASDGQWRVLDWCNGESYRGKPRKTPLELKLAKNDTTYGEIWFTFNDEYAWKQHDYN
jgi:hypothetical protein